MYSQSHVNAYTRALYSITLRAIMQQSNENVENDVTSTVLTQNNVGTLEHLFSPFILLSSSPYFAGGSLIPFPKSSHLSQDFNIERVNHPASAYLREKSQPRPLQGKLGDPKFYV